MIGAGLAALRKDTCATQHSNCPRRGALIMRPPAALTGRIKQRFRDFFGRLPTQFDTATIAATVASMFLLFSAATQMRPESTP
jgi:hypothetical protein